MQLKEYKWDITLLRTMREKLLQAPSLERCYRDFDLAIIDELLSLVGDQRLEKLQSIKRQIKNIYDNITYVNNRIEEEQAFYLDHFKKRFNQIPSSGKVKRIDFSIQDILSLLEEFIDWFPSKKLAQFLKIYYQKYFSTHFFYCQEKNLFPYRGTVYQLNHFMVPFMIVKKDTFVETFVTLIHEMGHVLIHVLDLQVSKSKCGILFSEIDGRYFEALARIFLEEKNIDVEGKRKSSIDTYNDIVSYSKKIKQPSIFSSFALISVEERLTEIYSYLGALELLERYHGDYEKQLYDLIYLQELESDNVTEYLKMAGFHWRDNDFKLLEKKRASFIKK